MLLYPTLLLILCLKVTLACFFFFTSPFFQGCGEVFGTFCCLHPMLMDNLKIFSFNHVIYNSQKCRGLELSSRYSPTAFLLWRTPDFYVVPLCNLQDLWSWRGSSTVLKGLKQPQDKNSYPVRNLSESLKVFLYSFYSCFRCKQTIFPIIG